MTEIPHEHDAEGNCIPPEGGFPVVFTPPTWRFSMWDIAGIAFHTVSGVLQSLGSGTGLLAQECAAMANWTRQKQDLEQAQAEQEKVKAAMAEDLRAMIEGGSS